jgi:CDP-glucose 4,6-dehydratase
MSPEPHRPEPVRSGLFDDVYAGRRVLVTGDTGFLGGWATRWLTALGAEVAGYSRGAGTGSCARTAVDFRGDITDAAGVAAAVDEFAPEVIIHLAGAATVVAGFRSPLHMFAANVTGTCAVLDAALRQPATKAVVVAGTPAAADLDDALELNPYPASKAAVEAAVGAYGHPRTRELAGRDARFRLGVARPGVMLGGDWAEGRLLADVVRNVRAGEPVVLRAPAAVRPWQHVLDGVGGMLLLGARLYAGDTPRRRYEFGRLDPGSAEPVVNVVDGFLTALGKPDWPVRVEGSGGDRIELGAAAAHRELGWAPVWDLTQTLHEAARWYGEDGTDAVGPVMDRTIDAYASAASAAWRRDLVRA